VRCPWLLAETKVATILGIILLSSTAIQNPTRDFKFLHGLLNKNTKSSVEKNKNSDPGPLGGQFLGFFLVFFRKF
jgi:hypothetical protein